MSRSLGDFHYKKNSSLPAEQQIVTADPDVIVHDITEEDEFLVIACDGWFSCPYFSLYPHTTIQASGTVCPHRKLLISFDSKSRRARSSVTSVKRCVIIVWLRTHLKDAIVVAPTI
jgi:hypothetical protein